MKYFLSSLACLYLISTRSFGMEVGDSVLCGFAPHLPIYSLPDDLVMKAVGFVEPISEISSTNYYKVYVNYEDPGFRYSFDIQPDLCCGPGTPHRDQIQLYIRDRKHNKSAVTRISVGKDSFTEAFLAAPDSNEELYCFLMPQDAVVSSLRAMFLEFLLLARTPTDFNRRDEVLARVWGLAKQVRERAERITNEDYKARLDEFAFQLVTQFNEIHRSGFALDNSTGNNLFEPLSETKDAARKISIAQALNGAEGKSKIAASKTKLDSSYPNATGGDNLLALELGVLEYSPTLSSNSETFLEFYQGLVKAELLD